MDNRFRVVIGDWSSDGHGKSDEYVFQSNKSVEEMQQAYKDSCALTGVQFNHNATYTASDPTQRRENRKSQIFCEYEDGGISKSNLESLTSAGLDVQKYCGNDIEKNYDDISDKYWVGISPEGCAYLILDFIKLSLPDLEYEEAFYKFTELKKMPPLNGWWCEGLNHQFGYGLYE